MSIDLVQASCLCKAELRYLHWCSWPWSHHLDFCQLLPFMALASDSFYSSYCFSAVHLVLRCGSFLFFVHSIPPLYQLLICGPNSVSNLCLYTSFKSTSRLLIFLLVLSPTSYFAIYSVNTKVIPNYSMLLLETLYCVRVGSVIIFVLVRIIY